MGGLVAATALLTRVPVGRSDERSIARAVPWFPVVGGLIGLASAGVYAVALLALPALVAGGLAVAASVLLTGALHEDGLADVADAAGGWSHERRLEILKDPTHGTYGVLAIVLSIVLRAGAIAALGPAAALGILPAAHALGRASAAALLAVVPPAREGLGARYAGASRLRTGAAVTIACGVAVAGLGVWAVAAVAISALSLVGTARVARRAFGGATGDVAGACEQVAETGVLLLGAAAVSVVWWR